MRKTTSWFMALAAMLLVNESDAISGGKRDEVVTLHGTITCGKCDLRADKKCATVIVVKKGEKEKVYYFDRAAHRIYHGDVCQTPKLGSVTGVISKAEERNIIKVTKVEYR